MEMGIEMGMEMEIEMALKKKKVFGSILSSCSRRRTAHNLTMILPLHMKLKSEPLNTHKGSFVWQKSKIKSILLSKQRKKTNKSIDILYTNSISCTGIHIYIHNCTIMRQYWDNFFNTLTTLAAIKESKPEVGLSQINRGVSVKASEAKVKRLRSPPDRPLTRPDTPIIVFWHLPNDKLNLWIICFCVIVCGRITT